MPTDRNALMIIRAWVEPESPRPLRVQIRLTGDVSVGFERSLNLAASEEVGAVVDTWLQELLTARQALPVTLP